MKLIIEQNFDEVKYSEKIDEATGKKDLYIEGIFLQSEQKNRNGRVYSEEILDREANRYVSQTVSKNRGLGELNHPAQPSVNPERASHRTTELRKEGFNWVGKALVLNTPMGNIVRGLMEGGTQVGVSSRGLGTLTEGKGKWQGVKVVNDDYYLSTVDIVSDPSAPEAWMNGIYEGCEWCISEDNQQLVEIIKKDVDKKIANSGNKFHKGQNDKVFLEAFTKMIDSLS
jgi:hypothetical protein